MSNLIAIKPGDFVLASHPFMTDAFRVYEAVSVTGARFIGRDMRGEEQRRDRSCVRGVFSSPEAARAAHAKLPALGTEMRRREREARADHERAALSLLTQEGSA